MLIKNATKTLRILSNKVHSIDLILQQSSVVCELAINPAFAQALKFEKFDANRPSAVMHQSIVSVR